MESIYKRRLCDNDNAAGDTIRIVDISPGPTDAPLECRLRYAKLDEKPVYDAISYCWGGQVPTISMMCEGRQVKITQNLFDAFSTFRRPDTTVALWADALCINQSDNREKSHQVSLMWKIYSQAREVRVWFGPDPDGCANQVIEILENLRNRAEQVAERSNSTTSELLSNTVIYVDAQRGVPSLANLKSFAEEFSTKRREGFYNFLRHPWFRRAWIVQEVVMSNNAVVYWGASSVPWRTTRDAIAFFYRSGIYSSVASSSSGISHLSLQPVIALMGAVERFQDSEMSLLDVLMLHRASEASDPRDKVLAFTNLAMPGDDRIVADYSADTQTTYKQVVEVCLAAYPTFSILQVPPIPRERSQLQLPSWVPDWSAPALGTLVVQNLAERDGPGTAAQRFDAALTSRFPKSFNVRDNILELSGFIVDEIVSISDCYSTPDYITSSLAGATPMTAIPLVTAADIYSRCKVAKSGHRNSSYPTGEDSFSAMIKTLCALQHVDSSSADFPSHTFQHLIRSGRLAAALDKLGFRHVPKLHSLALRILEKITDRLPGADKNEDTAPQEDIAKFLTLLSQGLNYQNLFRTRLGYLGRTLSCRAKKGDCIALVRGCRQPLILRRLKGNPGSWTLEGASYLHGAMRGELFDVAKCETLRIV